MVGEDMSVWRDESHWQQNVKQGTRGAWRARTSPIAGDSKAELSGRAVVDVLVRPGLAVQCDAWLAASRG
jgi:hypothetical protein